MKKLLLFIVLAVTTGGLFAQTNFRFADSTAQWITLEETIAPGVEHYFTNEFFIGGTHIIYGNAYQDVSHAAGTEFYIRKDTLSKVWLLESSDSIENLIYDFGLSKADTVRIYDHLSNSYSIVCHVDSIDSVNLGHYRKRMFMSCGQYLDELYHPDVWVDGIGSLYSYLVHPGSDSIEEGGLLWLETLLCYYEQNQLVYSNPNYNYCDIDTIVFTGIKEIASSVIQLIPNPVTQNFITIQTESDGVFQLFDITGRMVLQKQLTGKETTVPLNEISKGLYVYTVTSFENKMGSGKLVVQ